MGGPDVCFFTEALFAKLPSSRGSLFGGQVGFRECSPENALRHAFPGESPTDSLPEIQRQISFFFFSSCVDRGFTVGSGLTIYTDGHTENKVQTNRVWVSSPVEAGTGGL